MIAATNKYIVEVEPWVLARRARTDNPDPAAAERLVTVLATLAEALRLIAWHLAPFLPETAAALAQQLGIRLALDRQWEEAQQWGTTVVGTQVQPNTVLFPKLA